MAAPARAFFALSWLRFSFAAAATSRAASASFLLASASALARSASAAAAAILSDFFSLLRTAWFAEVWLAFGCPSFRVPGPWTFVQTFVGARSPSSTFRSQPHFTQC